jgi:hypothetical protein
VDDHHFPRLGRDRVLKRPEVGLSVLPWSQSHAVARRKLAVGNLVGRGPVNCTADYHVGYLGHFHRASDFESFVPVSMSGHV